MPIKVKRKRSGRGSRRSGEDRLLGLNYLKTGDKALAQEAIAQAAKYSGTAEAGLVYSQKLRLLGAVE